MKNTVESMKRYTNSIENKITKEFFFLLNINKREKKF